MPIPHFSRLIVFLSLPPTLSISLALSLSLFHMTPQPPIVSLAVSSLRIRGAASLKVALSVMALYTHTPSEPYVACLPLIPQCISHIAPRVCLLVAGGGFQ